MRLRSVSIVAVLFWLAAAAPAAPPTVPASLPYQGLLLDGLGQPRTGSVDLVVRVYDAVSGGTLVYKQSFPSVALADGVFTVQLGPTGEGTDSPANPLTTDLATALAGDAGITAPVRFLEVTVGTDGPLTRTQVLSSAYALRASSAAAADTAQSATTAASAGSAAQIGGLPAGFVEQLFTYTNFDSGDPPNFDPSEGLADVDGDGRANFIDDDNDGDAYSDVAELANGTNINLVTPTVQNAAPGSQFYTSTGIVTVNGLNFVAPLTVQFGSQSPTPTSVTPTSFQVAVGPQAPGVVNVTVTNGNGESDAAAGIFEFRSSFANTINLSPLRTTIDLLDGDDEVVLGGLDEYGVGPAGEAEFPFASEGSIAMAWSPGGAVAGLRCRDLGAGVGCAIEISVDSDADRVLTDETPLLVGTLSGSNVAVQAASLRFDPSGGRVAGYVRRASGVVSAAVAHDRNGDGDFADANELVTLESNLGFGGSLPADLAVDSAGRVAYVYPTYFTPALRAAWDRNGDGDFTDTIAGNPELSTIASAPPTCMGAAFDGADHLVVIYGNASGTTLLRDGNGDGDFQDAGESVPLAVGATTRCDVAFEAGQPLAAVHDVGGLKLLVDKNGDGDFADAGESTSFPQGGNEAALALNGASLAVIAVPGEMVIGTTD